MSHHLSVTRFLAATAVVFVVLEVTAALWHLVLFRDFYVAETAVMDRPFGEYVVPYLMATNLLRAGSLVALFEWWFSRVEPSYHRGIALGALVGLVCGLVAAEYFGVWRFRSLAWPLMEGGWLVAQGVTVGLSATWTLTLRRAGHSRAPRTQGT